jgi:hypothetical protein
MSMSDNAGIKADGVDAHLCTTGTTSSALKTALTAYKRAMQHQEQVFQQEEQLCPF